ncbi:MULTISPECIES: (2Fe-2S)-binding protein [Thalassomonas]|uniref:(2Fe-2S)-binding protein n=1 Tax=Thalassomonas actiniarum TaxID=485447 RepID=A0AAF0C6N3_9GAMM|nr:MULTISPECIES: (2Fe-2S)-binding protein [Thalassomonas]WDE02491.1 (2Fe-2S)-binding protein [Thalassomonas actiniarum]
MIEFMLNGKKVTTSVAQDTPLLWVLRDEFKLTGTKFGCGIAMCGACTVHLGDQATRSCVLPVSAVAGQEVRTIEGLEGKHPLQKAWVDEQVPQCGYCQSGQIMQAATLLATNANPSDDDIVNHMNSNLCRCMAYKRIKSAIKTAAATSAGTVEIYDPQSESARELSE